MVLFSHFGESEGGQGFIRRVPMTSRESQKTPPEGDWKAMQRERQTVNLDSIFCQVEENLVSIGPQHSHQNIKWSK